MCGKDKEKQASEPKHYSILSDVLFFCRFFREHEPVVLWCCLMQIVLETLVPVFGIYLPKLTVDLLMKGADMGQIVLLLSGFTLLMVMVYGMESAVNLGKYHFYNDQRTNLIGLVFLKSLRVKYEYVESGRMKKLYWKAVDVNASGDASASSSIITGTVGMLSSMLCFLLYSTVISTLSWKILLFVLLFSAASYLANIAHIRYEESLRDERAQANRQYYCVKNMLGNVRSAKDIRIFGMHPWLLGLRDKAVETQTEIGRRSYRKRSFYEKLQFFLNMVRDVMTYGFLVFEALHGRMTAGDFVLYFGAVTGFSGFVMGMMNSLSNLRSAANSTDYLRAYLELPEEDRTSGSRHIGELALPLEIEFRDVCFSYKDAGELSEKEGETQEKLIFDHISLTIRAGENLALVGVNGAGKTTFVKLLCGMYDPDSGQILLNGIDRNAFPREELYALFSVVFQEQLLLPFTVGENLAFSRAEHVDGERAWLALEKAGLKHVFEEKGIGIKSYMTKIMMKSGVELSGGQQQRFLLARALYKDAPILVLDEPTAALDPIAESEVYESYSRYSKDKTAVFISHRLASTRFSDRIVMLEHGRILEMGSHEELMEKNGAYAAMFRLQSSYYGEKGEAYGN